MSGTPIIVPVHLDAICVGRDDAKQHLSCFAPPLYDFSNLDIGGAKDRAGEFDRTAATPFISERLAVQRFGRASAKPAGVYLHWAMPAGLTHGVVKYKITPEVLNQLRHEGLPASILNQLDPSKKKNQIQAMIEEQSLSRFKRPVETRIKWAFRPAEISQGKIDWYVSWVSRVASHMTFPALPDRWLVVRVWTDRPDLPHRAWLIESDFVSANLDHDPQYVPSATIPWPFTSEDGATPEDATRPFFRYLGRVRRLEGSWREGTPEERVSRLTAIGYGKSAFAAYLPNCQNVFSHYDCLDDVQLDGTHALTYIVVGWYSRPENDPYDPKKYPRLKDQPTLRPRDVYWLLIQQGQTLPDVERNLKPQEIEDNDALKDIARSYYSGVINGVQWNRDHAYARPDRWDPEKVHVAMGCSEAEALAAYLAHNETSTGLMTPEEKVEALQLGVLKSVEDAPEPEVLLEQVLHASDFHAKDGGTIWQIARRSWGDAKGSVAEQFDEKTSAAGRVAAQLPPVSARALAELNLDQRLFDALQFFGEAQRGELFFHWYNYLKWSYGIAAEDGAYRYLDRASELLQNLEQLTTAETLPAKIAAALTPGSQGVLGRALGELARMELAGGPIADQPIQNLPVLEKALSELSGRIIDQAVDLLYLINPPEKETEYRLWVERAPRFFQPNEPHLLIADETSPVSSRFDIAAKHPLVCQRLKEPSTCSSQAAAVQLSTADDKGGQLNDEQVNVANYVLAEALAALAKDAAVPAIPVTSWGVDPPGGSAPSNDGVDCDNPWHPIILEWRVKWHGFPRPTSYNRSFIMDKTTLDEDGIDLCYSKAGGADAEGAPEYTASYDGTIVLSRRALSTLQEQKERYLGQRGDPEQDRSKDPLESILSQALHGFNDALITRLKEVQPAVYDPYATGQQEKEDMVRVRAAIGQYNDHAPKDLAAYNPIRAGWIEVEKIRLVDVFGQCRTIENPALILPQRLQRQDSHPGVLLPPRLVQPSRLLFRWLSAADEQPVEMNSHPDTSPICGWVVSNCLDDSLMIYAQDGTFLGSIREGRGDQQSSEPPLWESPPGVPASPQSGSIPQNIPNAQLREFVAGFLGDTGENFRIFRDKIERVLHTIEPQSDLEQDALAILMGRPLALVRAMLCLELKGPPLCRLDEDSYSRFLASGRLADDDFPAVQFPVRLGDLSSGGDGLVGYFKATAGNELEYNLSTFQAEDEAENILLASYDRVVVTMLVDPRASVHATSGILPVKTIDIPPDQYAGSLQRMAFTFAVHPVLSPGRLRLPLPAESDQSWAWWSKSAQDKWQDPLTAIGKIADWAGLGQGETLRLVEGWLQVNPLAAEEETRKGNSAEG